MQATAINLAEVADDVSARSRRDAVVPNIREALVHALQRDCASIMPLARRYHPPSSSAFLLLESPSHQFHLASRLSHVISS